MITASVATILGIGVAVGVYRSQINNNSIAVKMICAEVEVTKAKADQNEKDLIKIQSAVNRTDERTGDIKKSFERIEERLKN